MFYPGEGLVKKHIGTVAMSFFKNAVVQDGGVKIRVAGRIAAGTGISLADASAAMDEDFVKTALVRSIGPFIPQMPFAENTCGITGRFEHLRDRRGLQHQSLSFENSMSNPIPELVSAGHERASSRRTGWANVKIGKAHAFVMQSIDVWGLEDRMPVTGHVSVALVVGQNENNVWPSTNNRLRCDTKGCQRDDEKRNQRNAYLYGMAEHWKAASTIPA